MNPITREESLLDGQDLTPITRKEQFIKRIYDKTQEVPTPVTREEYFLKKAGEGTSPVAIEQLNVTENGTYSETGKAYSPVIVEVPESTLITKTITENGTYTASSDNADGYSSVTVAVEGFKKKSIANIPTDIASFNDGTANPMPSLEISIEPQQDLHGYDNPWVGGAGKNKVDVADAHITSQTDMGSKTLPSGTYVASATVKNNSNIGGQIKIRTNAQSASSTVASGSIPGVSGTNRVATNSFTLSEPTNISIIVTGVSSGYNFDVSQVQIELGSTATSYAPYSNICPISGRAEANVTVADDLTTPTETHTLSIPFHDNSDNPITVYGGTLNVTSGELRVTHANIASYNGETINEPWISSMDVYSAGATPTTGAQVVYPLATPQTYQLTPAQVTTLLGQNNIFADCGQILEGEYFVTL